MARQAVFDLRGDSRRMMEHQWLQEGEWLREYVPTWRLVRFEGLPRPYPTAGQAWAAIGRFVVRIPLYLVLVFFIVMLMSEGGGEPSGSGRKGPPVVVWGEGLQCRAGSLAVPALRRRGVWALTDRRVAFLGIRGRTYSKLFSSNPEPDAEAEEYRPVRVETVAEFPVGEWSYEGTVERTRRTRVLKRVKPAGPYHRIVFADGSGIDIRKRR